MRDRHDQASGTVAGPSPAVFFFVDAAEPPMQYFEHAVALEVGYDSEAAFSRVFKKIVGRPPAEWRRRAAPRLGRRGTLS